MRYIIEVAVSPAFTDIFWGDESIFEYSTGTSIPIDRILQVMYEVTECFTVSFAHSALKTLSMHVTSRCTPSFLTVLTMWLDTIFISCTWFAAVRPFFITIQIRLDRMLYLCFHKCKWLAEEWQIWMMVYSYIVIIQPLSSIWRTHDDMMNALNNTT
jgi:hypothetical protein